MVYLITGKAGAGKTHYAQALAEELLLKEINAIAVDGDVYREKTENRDFSDEGRLKNLMGVAQLAAEYEDQGYVVVLSFIAPRREWRYAMRKLWQESRVVYIPGGMLWAGTNYDVPDQMELNLMKGTENG